MAIITMRNEIVKKFGKDSFEGGYIQHLFANRDPKWVEDAYKKFMAKGYTKR